MQRSIFTWEPILSASSVPHRPRRPEGSRRDDGASSLECKSVAWQTFEQCPGPAGCTVSEDRRFVDCDGAPEETLLPGDE